MCSQTEYYKDMAEWERRPMSDSVDDDKFRANDTLTVWRDQAGEYRWTRKSANGRKLATSGEGYRDWKDCFDMAKSLWPDKAILVNISGGENDA